MSRQLRSRNILFAVAQCPVISESDFGRPSDVAAASVRSHYGEFAFA